jgi:hypothetical protein
VHAILTLTNPDLPMCDDQEFFLCLRVNYPALSLRSNDPRNFANLRDDLSRRFSSSMKRSPRHHLHRATSLGVLNPQQVQGAIPPELLPTRAPSGVSRARSLHSTFVRFSQVMKSPSSGRSRSRELLPPLLSLAAETHLRPALTCTFEYPKFTLGKREQEFNYLASSTHSMRRSFTALYAGISRPKQRNN